MANTGAINVRQYMVFILNAQRYGIPFQNVERVIRACEITPLPKAPEIVLGAINIEGDIIGVISMHRYFHLPEREVSIGTRYIIVSASSLKVALAVDEVTGTLVVSERDFTEADRIVPGLSYIQGAVNYDKGMILISDLGLIFARDDEQLLSEAIDYVHRKARHDGS